MAIESKTMVPGSGAVDFAVRGALDELVARVRDALGEHCRAVLLGGSLARGQGMAWSQGETQSLLSDIDVYVIREGARAATESVLTRDLRDEAATRTQVECKLDLAFVSPNELRNRARTLHLQQLRNGHRVLFCAPDFHAESCLQAAPVEPDEAQRLLLNRCCEQVAAAESTPNLRSILDLKLLIDAPLAVLASYGAYEPSRRRQRERLRGAVSGISAAAVDRLEAGLQLGEQWRARAMSGALDAGALGDWGGRAAAILPSFASACLRATLMAREQVSTEDNLAGAWERACQGGSWVREDLPLLTRWQRRGGRMATLRRARQWAPLAPVPIQPWWWHGWWGSGADLVYAAGVRRWASDSEWLTSLHPVLAERPRVSGMELDRWFGRLWADWILGKGRR